ncbi:hypothetical protein Dda_1711 [Drechslerella dactyloides]|uniref:Endonuclease/exonuclease/phosphatase domain-containing protein n=1 Tax=Drechslerella dactyloides TaxID=74499 RepID=A0AAD6J2Z9_DREDA|nr:hypothetical protein Dda_1711 [Drechslerella dactyloides]
MQLSSLTAAAPLLLRIVSHNIRYATTAPFRGEELWPVRLPHLTSQLHHLTASSPTIPTVLHLQEVLHSQLVDVLSSLNADLPPSSHWSSIGVHRNDGKLAGEASPILYQPSILTPLTNETTWLSPTPTVPSKGWDASSIRIVTHGIFRHTPTNTTLAFLSTHLDDQGSVARLHAAEMLISIIAEYRAQGLHVVLAGDFNSEPTQEAYRRMAASDSGVVDVRSRVTGGRVYGENNTYTGFGHDKDPESVIDFIFVDDEAPANATAKGDGRKWKVNGYAVMPNKFADVGVFISDHRAVVADLELS